MRALLLSAALQALACGGSPGPAESTEPNDLSWLDGTWLMRGEGEGLDTFELWGEESGTGGMLGLSVRVDRGGVPSQPELMRIEPGAAALVALPRGQHRTRFPRTEAGPRAVRFEAPRHDSPKWIAYRRDAEVLEASIGDGAEPLARWRFERIPSGPIAFTAEVEVCREGDEIEVTHGGCQCGAHLYCGTVDASEPLRVVMLDYSCDACVAAVGRCPYESTLAIDDGACATRRAPAITIADLRAP